MDILRTSQTDLEQIDLLLELFPEPWAVLLAFLDESGTDDTSPAMCVAGLLYERSAQKKLNRQWKAELEKAGIDYFHMREFCHRVGQFKGKDSKFCDQLHRSLIGIIKEHVIGGAAVLTMPEREFNAIRGQKWEFSQYTTCAYACVHFLLGQASRLRQGPVHFFIESGHERQGELARLLEDFRVYSKLQASIMPEGSPHAKWRCFAASVFAGKKDIRSLQTADALAYELVKHERNRLEEREMRKSLKAILGSTKNWTIRRLDRPMLSLFAGLWEHMPRIPDRFKPGVR